MKDFVADPQQASPGHGQMKPEQLEIERLRREVQKLKAERDILKRMATPSAPPEFDKFQFLMPVSVAPGSQT